MFSCFKDSNLLDLLQSLIIGFIDVLPVFDLQKFSLPSVVKENITTVMMNFPLLKLDCAEYGNWIFNKYSMREGEGEGEGGGGYERGEG